ncbi:MAG: Phosphoadenosine phosphosulfate reductase [Gammaproteobacteria bacterium]|jgi:phosphoadenosine phosphosulfate reductase|nr:Phosphoadenosine phosphosulfate reductase [Gammaproteobacteria bacterium]
MGELLNLELEQKTAAVRERLAAAVGEYGRVVYSNSLGAEAMVLTDIIWSSVPEIDVFSIDTGRLPEETYELLEKLQRRYKRNLRVVYPDAEALEGLVAAQGVNGFYHSLEARQACCRIRKVEPFKRAIAGYGAWVTGVRHEQSATRAMAEPVEWDAENGLHKISPILDWTEEQVWQYIRTRKLPYNSLHDRQYPSIGCSPCTRAIQPGESRRAGRWWWEQPESRECGLHPRVRHAAAQA